MIIAMVVIGVILLMLAYSKENLLVTCKRKKYSEKPCPYYTSECDSVLTTTQGDKYRVVDVNGPFYSAPAAVKRLEAVV